MSPGRVIISPSFGRSRRAAARRAGGYTLVELFVVVSIILIVLAVALPAFTAMTASMERASADNTLRVALQIASNAGAAQTEGDTAVFFLHEPEGRLRLVPAVMVGTFEDLAEYPRNPAFPNARRPRDVFVPIDGVGVLELPEGWMISGYAPPGSMAYVETTGEFTLDNDPVAEWYDGAHYGPQDLPDPGSMEFDVRNLGHWLAPETGFYNVDQQLAVNAGGFEDQFTPRQTFMMRFELGSGLPTRLGNDALLIDPRPSPADRDRSMVRYLSNNATEADKRALRVDLAEDLRAWAQVVLFRGDLDLDGLIADQGDVLLRSFLVGLYSHDTVMARPVSRLALYKQDEFLRGIGVRRPNAETGTLYLPAVDSEFSTPEWDENLFDSSNTFGSQDDDDLEIDVVRARTNAWMEGDTTSAIMIGSEDDPPDGLDVFEDDGDDVPVARLFTIQALTGELVELTPGLE